MIPGIRVLMYHSICDNPRDPWAVTPMEFAQQMAGLADQHLQVISMKDALLRLERKRIIWNAVVLTFDDAYHDFCTEAVPILRTHDFPATVFVPTGLVGGTALWDSYDRSKQLMDWNALEAITTYGITLGSHTVTHPRLSQVDDTTLHYELRESWIMLRDNISQNADAVLPLMAYPFGDAGKREVAAVKRAGYVGGLGIHHQWGNQPWTSRYCLERLGVKGLTR